MGSLVECGLANAAIALALAVLALLAGRYSRRPALVHALWALVLVKLVTPPLVGLPLLPGLVEERPPAEEPPVYRAPPPVELAVAAPPAEAEVLPQPLPPGAQMKIQDLIPDFNRLPRFDMPVLPGMPGVPIPMPPAAPVRDPAPAANPRPQPVPMPVVRPRPVPPPPRLPVREALELFGWAWLGGAVIVLTTALWRVSCFQRLLRYARPAPEALQDQARAVARRLGLRRCPPVYLLPGPIPPLLWAASGRAQLFFPAHLLPRLDEAGRAALLAHEMAHLARRDHWVRWLELLAGCAYWWYPLVYVARKRLQAAEEECCDAWVVSTLPGHGPAYAGALLETVDFLSRQPAPLPPTASGFGRVHQLKRRLTMIVQGSTPRGLSLAGKVLVLGLALALPLTPSRARPAAGPPPARKDADKPAAKAAAKAAQQAVAEDTSGQPAEPDRYSAMSRALFTQGGQVWQVAISPDGKTLAVAHGGTDGEGALSLWELATGKMTALVTEGKPIRAVAFSPDGKLLATGEFDNSVKLRDPRTGAVVRTLAGHTAGANSVAFTPDGKTLLSGGLDRTVRYWDVASGKNTRTLSDHTDAVLSVAISPDGKTLVSASQDRTARVYDLSDGKLRHHLKGHSNWAQHAAISPDNDTIATVGPDRTVRLWSASSGKALGTIEGHNGFVNSLAFFDEGKKLATVSDDLTVKFWDVESRNLMATIDNAHTQRIWAVAFSPDGKTLITGSWDRTVKVFDAATRREQRALQPKRYAPETAFPILALAASPDGQLLAVAGEEKVVKLLDAATGRLIHLLEGHDDMVGGVAFSPDGKLLATAGFDGDVRLWDTASGKPVRTLKGHVNWVFCVAFSPDGTRLASGGYDKTVRVWDVSKGTEVLRLNKHKGGVRAVAYTRDGGLLATAGTDKLIRVWDLSKKEVAHTLRGHEDVVRSVAFSPDGKRLVSGSEDNTVRLWDIAGEKQISSSSVNAVQVVAWSPRGATIAAGGRANILTILDPNNLSSRGNFFDQQGSVTAVAFSPDATKLYSAGTDQTVRVREGQVPTQRPVVSYPGRNMMKVARFSPDGKWLAMSGEDRRLEVRNARFGRLEGSVSGLGQSGYQVAVSPDGKKLVSGAGDWSQQGDTGNPGEVKVWDLSGMQPKEEASLATAASVQAVAWSRDGKHLAVGSRDGLARLLDAATRKELHLLKGHTEGEVRSLDFSRDGKHLATAGNDGTVRVWAVATGKELAKLDAHTAGQGTNSVVWSPDGKHLASVSNRNMPGQVFVWSVETSEEGALSFGKKRLLTGFTGRTLAAAFSPDSKTLLVGGGVTTQYGEAHVFDVASGRHLAALQGQTNWVEGVAFTPDGKLAVAAGGSVGRPGEMHMWNVERAGGWSVDNAHKQSVFAAAWSPDGKSLLTGGYDGSVKTWDAATGELKSTLETGQEGVRAMAVSKDGKWLATGGQDRTVKLWDLTDDKDGTELAKFDKVVNSVAFSPDGKLLAACCCDPFYRDRSGSVKVIEVETGREKAGPWQKRDAMAVAFSPDGKSLATGSLGSQGVVVYDLASGKATRVIPNSGVFALEYSKDGRLLVTAHGNGNVEVRDTRTWGAPVVCTGNTQLAPMVSIAPDGMTVATASHDRTVKLFDLRNTNRPPRPGMVKTP